MSDIIERLRTVDVSWSEVGEWCAEAADTIEALSHHLSELLAVLHGDGGHYLAEHGMDKAVADALTRYYGKLTAADATQYELRKQVAELRENGDRLLAVADSAVEHQREMVEAACKPLRDQLDALQAKLNPTVLRCMHCDYATELQHVCEQCGERWAA